MTIADAICGSGVQGLLRSNPQIASADPRLAQLQIGERQLDVRLSIVLVLLEREGDVERGLVLGEVVVALGGAPGDGAEDPAVLLERHLEVALLQLARAVDDLDAARREHRPRVAGAERRERRDAGGDAAGDAAERRGRRRSAAAASGRRGRASRRRRR